MSSPDSCPSCKANLQGELIYETFLHKGMEPYYPPGNEQEALKTASHYGATKTEGRWGLALGIYDMNKDRTVAWRCPKCNHEWER